MMWEIGSLIVTGGSYGIGKAVIGRLVTKFSPQRVFNLDTAAADPVDVRDAAVVEAVISAAVEPEQEHYLFSNAGVVYLVDPATGTEKDFAAMPLATIRQMIEINVLGQLNAVHAFVRLVRERNAHGHIVLTSSISAEFPGGRNMIAYDASKAFVRTLGERLAAYAPEVRSNVIAPGSVHTNIGSWTPEFAYCSRGAELVQRGQAGDNQLIGSEVTTQAVADLVEKIFFDMPALNGATITIDGGLTKRGRGGY